MLALTGVGAFAGYDYCTQRAGEDTLRGCAIDSAVNMYRTLWGSPAASPDGASKGTVETETFDSGALGQRMEYVVYLPPGYDDPQNGSTRYPVVYLLPGVSGSTDTWVKAGDMGDQMDTLLSQGQVQPMILVVPQESPEGTSSNGGYVDGPLGNWATYTTRDLVNEIDSSYRTIKSKEGRAIAGDSEGGYGAMNLGLKGSSEFGVIGSFSGYFTPDEEDLSSVFGGDRSLADTNSPTLYLPRLEGGLPEIYLLVGQGDHYLEENEKFAGELKARDASVELNTFPGGHNWDFWRTHLPEFLIFAGDHLGG